MIREFSVLYRWLFGLALLAAVIGWGYSKAQVAVIAQPGHAAIPNATIAPTLSACSTGALTGQSTDFAGQFTATGSTTCTVNFARAFATAPVCVFSNQTGARGALTITTASLAFTGLTAADVVSYLCFGS